MTSLSVGIDIAKGTFTAASWRDAIGQPLGRFPNTDEGMVALAAALASCPQAAGCARIQIVVEPTGGYELALAAFAARQGWQVSMPNPRHIRDWARSQGRRAKTDAQDALMLARYGAEQQLPPWQPLPLAVSALESLLQRKDDLEDLLLQERNRQWGLRGRPGVAPIIVTSIARVIAELEQAVATIEQAITDHLAAHAALRQDVQLLRTVPGIGARNVLWLVVLMHRWHTRTAGQGRAKGIVAYVGLDPQPFESGTSVRRRARISRMGAAHLRRRLFMSAFGGVRGHNVLRQFYQRLVGRGKPKMVALIAAARKVLVWAWAVFRTRLAFDPQNLARRSPMTTRP
jgi:transposase